jgi:uncharacterized phage protein (TIGR02220 family)
LSDTCPHRLGKVRLGKVRLGKVSNIYSVAKDDTTDPQTNEVIEYLNTKTGKALRGSKADKKHINARFAEGYKLEDFQKVVDIKVAEWENDAEMSKYLRISTLFGTKFDTYLNQKPPKNGGQFAEEGMYDNLGW